MSNFFILRNAWVISAGFSGSLSHIMPSITAETRSEIAYCGRFDAPPDLSFFDYNSSETFLKEC